MSQDYNIKLKALTDKLQHIDSNIATLADMLVVLSSLINKQSERLLSSVEQLRNDILRQHYNGRIF